MHIAVSLYIKLRLGLDTELYYLLTTELCSLYINTYQMFVPLGEGAEYMLVKDQGPNVGGLGCYPFLLEKMHSLTFSPPRVPPPKKTVWLKDYVTTSP